MGLLLTRRSENATVTLCHTGTRDLAAEVRRADIVVAAAGVPGIITADMVKPGAALLDVGVSRDEAGAIVGDLAPDVREVAGWVAPNPGGVGPMTRAMLLSNVVEFSEKPLWRGARTSVKVRLPRSRGSQFYLLRWPGFSSALLMVVSGPWRAGLCVVGGTFVVTALARVVVSAEHDGMLSVRGQAFDVFWTTTLGVSLLISRPPSCPGPG